MSSRECDIQYGLLVTVAPLIDGPTERYNCYQIIDTGSIFKMTPYCHTINTQDTLKFERLLIIEITGQSTVTKDSHDLWQIANFYKERIRRGLKTVISISWITENTLSISLAYAIKELIDQGIDPKHIILFCPENFNTLRGDFVGFFSITGEEINIICCYHAEIHAYYRSYISQEQPLSKFSVDRPNKCLVNMAKISKHFRIMLLYEIFKGRQYDQFSVSVNTGSFVSIDDAFSKDINQIFGNLNTDAQFPSFKSCLKDNKFKEWIKLSEGRIDNFDIEEWDVDILKSTAFLGYPVDPKIFDNTCLSLVSETWVSGNFLTEKTFKPIINSHPFIINGGAGELKTLHSMGYKTFDFIIDESYDDIEDHELRIKEIYKQSLIFLKEYKNHLEQLEQVVEHNRQNHYHRGFEKFNEIRRLLIKISRNFFNYNPSLS